jgi:hypothetical protein
MYIVRYNEQTYIIFIRPPSQSPEIYRGGLNIE